MVRTTSRKRVLSAVPNSGGNSNLKNRLSSSNVLNSQVDDVVKNLDYREDDKENAVNQIQKQRSQTQSPSNVVAVPEVVEATRSSRRGSAQTTVNRNDGRRKSSTLSEERMNSTTTDHDEDDMNVDSLNVTGNTDFSVARGVEAKEEPIDDDLMEVDDTVDEHGTTTTVEMEGVSQEQPTINSSIRASLGRPERKSTGPLSRHSDAGVIQQIYVENFMCHRKLRVDLNRNVNFIHGQNGSGKSAILAAIQICLGANARRTHRARNLKDLVRKDGANTPTTAKVRVTLLNQQMDGYKYDTYGDTITVERVISLSGGYNGYRLLDQDMKEQSRSKKDLDDMLDTLNIQVENPVAVLDQEEAKKFLTGKAEDKYNFFMKATELERVDRTYASTVDTVYEMTLANDRVRDGVTAKIDQVDQLKKKYEEHLEVDRLYEKLEQMSVKRAWSYYHAIDAECNKLVESLNSFQKKAAVKEKELTQAEETLSSPGQDEAEKRERMDELLEEAKKEAAIKRELEDELQSIQAPHKVTERQLQTLKKDKYRTEKQLKDARQRLQTARDKMLEQEGSAESEQVERTNRLKKAEEELAAARDQVNQLKQTVSTALRMYEELEPHVQDAKSKCKGVAFKLQGVEGTIKDLESSSGNSLAMWGRNVEKVHNLVEKAKRSRRFRGDVIGPIGAYLKIVPGKEEFASIAELGLGGGNMDRFIVTNDNDRRVFQDIRKEAGCFHDCNVFQVKPHTRYKIPNPPGVEGIETIASVLKIENDLVFNCLVDNARIESIALARNKKLSEDVLLVQNGHQCSMSDPNISAVFCLPRGDQWLVKRGSLALFSNEKKLRSLIGVDKTAALEVAKRELTQLREDSKDLKKEEAKLEHDHSKYQREWNIAKKAMQKNDTKINDLLTLIDEIKLEMESSTNVTSDTTEFEEDVQEAMDELENLRSNENKLVLTLEETQPKIGELKNRIEESSLRTIKVLADIESVEKDIAQLVDLQSQQKDILERKRQKVEQYKEIMKKYQKSIDEQTIEKESAIREARLATYRVQFNMKLNQVDRTKTEDSEEKVCDPTEEELEAIEPFEKDEEPKYYEVRMTKLKTKLEVERQKKKLSKDDASVAYEKYICARDDVAARTKQVSEVEQHILELRNDLNERKRRWKHFRSHLTKKTNIKFSEMLSINDYSGELTFSHDDATLDLAVQKNSSNSQGVSSDVKALSGGERSYTTMCLLVALGETLETPFRILDEFDVFLDTEARKLTIKALIHVAKRMEHRQFIFITPQDLSSIQPDPKLKIHKLTPPERYNNAGGPSQQTLDFPSQSA